MKTAFRLITVLIMLSTLILFATACDSLPFLKPTLTPTITNTPLPTMPSEPLSAEQILKVAVERVDRQISYSYSYVIGGEITDLGFTYKTTGTGSVINPDQVYEVITTIINGESTTAEEMILGHEAYTRDSSIGPWERVPTPENPEDLNDRVYTVDVFQDAMEITLIGEEKLNDAIDCYHLQFGMETKKIFEEGAVYDVFINDLWVSKADLFIRRWSFKIPSTIQEYTLDFEGNFDFFSFNQPVTIPTPFFQP